MYIGQTIRPLNIRVSQHICDAKARRFITAFYNALISYGINSFDISIIDTANDHDTLNEKEKYWIKKENCIAPNGYNLTDGGASGSRSLESRIRIGNAQRGKKLTEEHKQKIREKLKGRKPWNTGIKMTEAQIKSHIGIPSRKKGKALSFETRKKISQSKKGSIPWNKGKTLNNVKSEVLN